MFVDKCDDFFCTNHVHKNERSGQTDDKVLFKVCCQATLLSCVGRNSVQLEHSLKHWQAFTVSLFEFFSFNFQFFGQCMLCIQTF